MAAAVDIIKIINLPAGRQVLANYILNPFQNWRGFFYAPHPRSLSFREEG
jgi:hypothetical protein